MPMTRLPLEARPQHVDTREHTPAPKPRPRPRSPQPQDAKPPSTRRAVTRQARAPAQVGSLRDETIKKAAEVRRPADRSAHGTAGGAVQRSACGTVVKAWRESSSCWAWEPAAPAPDR